MFFNLFLDDLFKELNGSPFVKYVERERVNSFAFADDLRLFGTTIPDVQALINICIQYANKWSFW